MIHTGWSSQNNPLQICLTMSVFCPKLSRSCLFDLAGKPKSLQGPTSPTSPAPTQWLSSSSYFSLPNLFNPVTGAPLLFLENFRHTPVMWLMPNYSLFLECSSLRNPQDNSLTNSKSFLECHLLNKIYSDHSLYLTFQPTWSPAFPISFTCLCFITHHFLIYYRKYLFNLLLLFIICLSPLTLDRM